MERRSDYRQLIQCYLQEYADIARQQRRDDVETLCLFDEVREQYMLMKAGWRDGDRVYAISVHARIKDGKIWIEEDWTEEGLGNYLVRNGVPKEDIVLAFQPPSIRPYVEFVTT